MNCNSLVIKHDQTGLNMVKKTTKYFLNLENNHQTNNRITSIKTEKGEKLYSPVDILREGVKFYRKLYNRKDVPEAEMNLFLDNIVTHNAL